MAKDPKSPTEETTQAAAAAAARAAQNPQQFARSTPSADDEVAAPRARYGDDQDDESPAPPVDPRAAVVTVRPDGAICRPPVGQPISALGDVIIGNWVGNLDGKPVRVCHGTPVRGLPRDLVRKIANTRGQQIGPYPPLAPQG